VQLSLFQPAGKPPVAGHPILKLRHSLEGRIPQHALEPVISWFAETGVILIVSRNRATKSGDFRPGGKKGPDRISVNRSLNPYAFLITIVHEMAHHLASHPQTSFLSTLTRISRRPDPHGKAWKNAYRDLMQPFLSVEIFPQDILSALNIHMQNPRAATFSDLRLSRAVENYDEDTGLVLLETLPEGSSFETATGRQFRKLEQRRKRFLCYCTGNKRNYLFSPVAKVRLIR
jgi:hypothetical protein